MNVVAEEQHVAKSWYEAQVNRLSLGLEAERIRLRELERFYEAELAAARNRIAELERQFYTVGSDTPLPQDG